MRWWRSTVRHRHQTSARNPHGSKKPPSDVSVAGPVENLGAHTMKLFVDTGHLKDIEALAATGILDGVTTNPSLMAKESGDPRALLKQICRVVQGPVSAEVVATDAAGMI